MNTQAILDWLSSNFQYVHETYKAGVQFETTLNLIFLLLAFAGWLVFAIITYRLFKNEIDETEWQLVFSILIGGLLTMILLIIFLPIRDFILAHTMPDYYALKEILNNLGG